MSHASLDHFASGNKAVLDTLHAFAGISLNSLEKIALHHLSSTRRALDQQIQQGKELLGSKELNGGTLALGGGFAQQHIGQSIDYLRSLHDISNEAQEDYISLFERSHGELNKSLSSILDWYSNAPGQTGVAVAAVRSAVSAANSAVESAHKTARQVANIADASVKSHQRDDQCHRFSHPGHP